MEVIRWILIATGGSACVFLTLDMFDSRGMILIGGKPTSRPSRMVPRLEAHLREKWVRRFRLLKRNGCNDSNTVCIMADFVNRLVGLLALFGRPALCVSNVTVQLEEEPTDISAAVPERQIPFVPVPCEVDSWCVTELYAGFGTESRSSLRLL